MDLSGVPSSVLEALQAARTLGIPRLALVGGVVRDQMLHQRSGRAWLGVPDLDWVVGECRCPRGGTEPSARFQTDQRCSGAWSLRHSGTAAGWDSAGSGDGASGALPRSCGESCGAVGNSSGRPARRDFTVNAMALDLVAGELIDLHHGSEDLAAGQLRFLHAESVQDDPTRVIRAARYAARLGFQLVQESSEQIRRTIDQWPWAWGQGDPALAAPPALSTRMRMELERLLEREPWRKALDLLEQWQALPLLDSQLQNDPRRTQRLHWARRLGLPLMPSLLLGAADPAAVAQRLQIPGKHQQWLQQCGELRDWLVKASPPLRPPCRSGRRPSNNRVGHRRWWPWQTLQPKQWKPLLRWWGRWRRIQAPQTARDLIAAGWHNGHRCGVAPAAAQRRTAADETQLACAGDGPLPGLWCRPCC